MRVPNPRPECKETTRRQTLIRRVIEAGSKNLMRTIREENLRGAKVIAGAAPKLAVKAARNSHNYEL